MLTIIKIPKVGALYPSKRKNTVARVLELHENTDGAIKVFFRDYAGHWELELGDFWNIHKEDEYEEGEL